jgi:hypothetical protein
VRGDLANKSPHLGAHAAASSQDEDLEKSRDGSSPRISLFQFGNKKSKLPLTLPFFTDNWSPRDFQLTMETI